MSNVSRPGIDALRRAQQALEAAHRGEKLPDAPKQVTAKKNTPANPKVKEVVLNEISRQAAIFRAVSLIRTMTQYYSITTGEVEDEEARLRQLSDTKLMGAISAYEYASKHIMVMQSDEKAREAAIARSNVTANFYQKHGVNEDDINEEEQKNRARTYQKKKS